MGWNTMSATAGFHTGWCRNIVSCSLDGEGSLKNIVWVLDLIHWFCHKPNSVCLISDLFLNCGVKTESNHSPMLWYFSIKFGDRIVHIPTLKINTGILKSMCFIGFIMAKCEESEENSFFLKFLFGSKLCYPFFMSRPGFFHIRTLWVRTSFPDPSSLSSRPSSLLSASLVPYLFFFFSPFPSLLPGSEPPVFICNIHWQIGIHIYLQTDHYLRI